MMSALVGDRARTDLPTTAPPASRRAFLILAGMIGLGILALNMRSLLFPVLVFDDFSILTQSWTWQTTVVNLWVPHNEHTMPLGRLLAFVVIYFVPTTSLPLAGVTVGVLSLLLAAILLYTFVRRELGQPFYGFVAVTLFALSTVYGPCVYWFVCTFWMLGLDTMLLALLAAQSWRQSGRGLYLDLCVLACALAPGWYAGTVLAGPLCCLYLLPPRKTGKSLIPLSGDIEEGESGKRSARFKHVAVTPLFGTLLFLAVSLPKTAATIMNLPHYGGKTALQAFDPIAGMINAGRSIIDNLLIGLLGFYVMDNPLPKWLSFVLLAAVAAIVVWWLWQAPEPRLILLGLAFILCSYWLIFSARASQGYGNAYTTGPTSGRYSLLPQFGLALMVCGGLPGRAGLWFQLANDGKLTGAPFRTLCILMGIFFVIQLPRGIACGWDYEPHQGETLRALEVMDARCREYHISATAAREILPSLQIPYDPANGWELLRGSDDPRQMDRDEVRRLLGGVN